MSGGTTSLSSSELTTPRSTTTDDTGELISIDREQSESKSSRSMQMVDAWDPGDDGYCWVTTEEDRIGVGSKSRSAKRGSGSDTGNCKEPNAALAQQSM